MKKHIINTTATMALFACLSTSTFAITDGGRISDEEQPDLDQTEEPTEEPMGPTDVNIRNLVYNGTGCPLGSVGNSIRDDGSIGLSLDEFYVESGPGIPRRESRKNCQLTISLDVPEGWSFAVERLDNSGYASLARGTYGEIRTTMYFQGASGRNNQVSYATRLRGPYDREFEINDEASVESILYSPCGASRALNINTSLRIGGKRDASAYMTLDRMDSPYDFNFRLRWRRCP